MEEWDRVLDELALEWRDKGPERRQDRSRRREQEILRAALRVFSREGIARARIGDVADEAGLPLSSLYEYFPSKEDLAYAVPVAYMAKFYIEYAERARQSRTARERLRMFLWLSADFARRNPDWARTLYLEIWPSVLVKDSPARKGLDDYGRFIVELIRQGGRQGEWAAGPSPYESATILIGSHNQMLITWLLYRKPRAIMRAIGPLIDRLLGTILPKVGEASDRQVKAAE
jgi:AcrR family transcriptional regulator